MIIAIAVICFIFGFGAAIAVTFWPSRFGSDIIKLLLSTGFKPHRLNGVREEVVDVKDSLFEISAIEATHEDGGLTTKEYIESNFEPSSWQSLAYHDFRTAILASETGMKVFPCIYATMGYRADEHRYVFLKSDNPAEPQNIRLIAPALRHYLSIAPSLGSNTSLVIVAAPSETERSVEHYNNNFWDMLRGLRIIDSKPWPRNVPEALDSEQWTFCFDGEPIFPVLLTPAHSQRWSRHMSVPVVALQPKWVLDRLLSTPEKREIATSKVRRLLKDFDQVDISPHLTTYGEKGTTEASQLCLLDNNDTAVCPYSNLDR